MAATAISARIGCPPPGGVDLLGERGERAARPWPRGARLTRLCQRPSAKPLAGAGGPGRAVGGGEREERAAGPVEVAGEDVEDVDQPAGEGAELDGAAADAAVDGGGGRGGQLAGERADLAGVHVAGGGDGLGREVPHGCPEFVDALDVRGQRAEVDEALLEEDVRHGGEQQRVGAGPDGDVPVGELGGAGAARVDDGERAAAGRAAP